MERRQAVTIVAVVLVVLAGCAGGGGPDGTPTAETGTESTTRTPTATATATPTSTAAPADGSGARAYPGGWSETGVTDVQSALESHYRAVLTGPSVTVQYRSRIVSAERDRASNTTLDMRIDTGERRLYADIEGAERHREAFFANRTLSEWSVRNETIAGRSDPSFVRVTQSIDDDVLRSQLLLYRLEVNETVARGDTTAFVYDVVGVHENTLSGTFGRATDASGRVVVSGRGRLLALETTVTYTGGRVTYRYAQARIGGTEVPTPEWAADA
jgi:hypothetical protein